MRYNVSSPVWREESNYMSIFTPANRASPVARGKIPSKRDGPASRAESSNRKVDNTRLGA